MEYVILYFSGTGNTELIANEITKRLENAQQSVELVSIEDKAQLKSLNLENKIIGFGYPVYKFSYPDIFDRILPQITQLAKDNEYFQFSTYARFDAQAFYDFSKRLDSNKFKLITQKSFKSPSCGISARKPFNDYEYESVMFFENQINERIDEFVDSILLKEKVIARQGHYLFNGLKTKIVKDIESTKYPKLNINQSQCIICGLCAKNCPDSNLINLQTHIDIVDDVRCLHCLRCINHCPANAITFGKLTEGDNQYTLKTRSQLYKKASDGYHEKYWASFSKVIKKWQRNTIRYWITHKHRHK